MPQNLNAIIRHANSYFENLAQSHIAIQHTPEVPRFAVMGIEQLISMQWNFDLGENFFALVLEAFEGDLAGPDLTNAEAKVTGAFWVLRFAGREDYSTQQQVWENSHRIGSEIIARIAFDKEELYHNDQSDPNQFVKSFPQASVHFNKVGPVGDNYHGSRFEFTIGHNNKLRFEPALWQ